MKVLIVLTSHDQLGNTGRKTGFWLEGSPLRTTSLKDTRAEITLASPKGGRPPLDPMSNEPEFRTDLTLRFEKDTAAEAQLDKTVRIDSVRQEDFDTLFYPGGHGPMWDLAEDEHSIKLIQSFLAAGKPIAIVCHSPARCATSRPRMASLLFRARKLPGSPTAKKKKSASQKWCHFSSKTRCELGAIFSKKANWAVHVVSDGLLITGQNPHFLWPRSEDAASGREAKGGVVQRGSR